MEIEAIRDEIRDIMKQWKKAEIVKPGGVFVVGCSTSEVAGKHIGKAGSMDIAQVIFDELQSFQKETGVQLAFQCCEHLNRALVVERNLATEKNWTVVSVIPQPNAGGSMATYAFQQMENPVLVEHIQADYGMDIGHTMIGMHLKHVAVPLRLDRNMIGDAHVVFAYTRPKLIGGERAVYRE